MKNFFNDSTEWRYLFKNAIDWDKIIPLYYPSFPTAEGFKDQAELLQFFEELLSTTGEWAAKTLAPRARDLDVVGGGTLVNGRVVPSGPLKQTYKEAAEMGILGVPIETEWGGMGLPVSIAMLGFEFVSRACVSSGSQIGFFTVIAEMVERYCDEETKARLIPRIVRGEISGSMCMTEPGAGSDVGAIRTSADRQSDGTYLLNGNKLFITNGGGGLGFVLARVKGAPAGLEGISIFLAEEFISSKTPETPEAPEAYEKEPQQNYRVTKEPAPAVIRGSFHISTKTLGRLPSGTALTREPISSIIACIFATRKAASFSFCVSRPISIIERNNSRKLAGSLT